MRKITNQNAAGPVLEECQKTLDDIFSKRPDIFTAKSEIYTHLMCKYALHRDVQSILSNDAVLHLVNMLSILIDSDSYQAENQEKWRSQ